MASPNLSEIVTTTIQSRTGALADNVTKNNAILRAVKRSGTMRTVSGGDVILQELEYAENSTYKRYSGYETLDISPQDVITAASFDYKQTAVAVTISGLEQLKNAGRERRIELVSARVKNAERTMANRMSEDLYSDGTSDSSKQIGGLQHLVPNDPTTGTVGGISRVTWSFWRPYVYDATTDGGGSATAGNIQTYMKRVWNQLRRGTDKPDLILADNNYHDLYWASLTAIQRVTKIQNADTIDEGIEFMGIPVTLDGGDGGFCPTNHMYFLNTNYIHYRPHAERNMVALDPDRFSTNQDAVVKLIGWAGNMTLSNGNLQGLLKD